MSEKFAMDINKRRLIDGPNDKLMQIAPVKHQWARDIWKVMIANTWTPAEVDLSRDVRCYREELTDGERQMYDRALAFLSNLDGIQLNNLVFNIGKHVTSPEVSMCLVRQAFEEALHVDSYSVIIEAIGRDPSEIYNMFRTNALLADKNEYIIRQSEILGRDYSPRNFAMAVVANIILEGIYFYSGFMAFYALGKVGKMFGTAKMIRLIDRDEGGTHLNLFVKMYEALQEENPEIFNDQFKRDAIELIKSAVDLETIWGKHIISGGVLGLTDAIVEDRIKYLADLRANAIGLGAIYGVKNPIPWVDKFSKIDGEDANFFEDKVSSYSIGTLEW
ncbi:MAG: ribonucleotide-diphosphate reductase subunit beta [Methylomicrobium sp.]|nr:ribonucleotide-diphosphate reductase subunit beta [Methylomicrobium sp.]